MLRLKTWSAREASIHSAFMGKWPTIISLIHPKDELSFKEIRMWGQSKISSCFICDWCESREMGGRGSPKFQDQWWKASLQAFFQLKKVIGQSRLLNCVYCLESRIQNSCK